MEVRSAPGQLSFRPCQFRIKAVLLRPGEAEPPVKIISSNFSHQLILRDACFTNSVARETTVSIFFPKVSSSDKVVAIDLALQQLVALDERKSNVLEMRSFGGLSIEETSSPGDSSEHRAP
jgi:hypothetical protein